MLKNIQWEAAQQLPPTIADFKNFWLIEFYSDFVENSQKPTLNFNSNQDFLWNPVNYQYILHTIVRESNYFVFNLP